MKFFDDMSAEDKSVWFMVFSAAVMFVMTVVLCFALWWLG